MGQIVNLAVGSFGVRASGPFWKQLIQQHQVNNQNINILPIGKYQAFFHQSNSVLNQKRIFKSRCILADLDPDTIDIFKFQNKDIKTYFNDQNLIFGKQQSCFYTRSYYTIGKEICQPTMDQFRRQLEKCDTCTGINTIYGMNGSSSGFANLLLQRIKINYPKIPIHNNCLIASPNLKNGITEYYDQMISFQTNIEIKNNSTTLFDNQKIYRVIQDSEREKHNINFASVNEVIAKQINFTTYGLRFNCSMPSSFNQIQTNLIPFPNLNFLSASLNSTGVQTQSQKDNRFLKKDTYETIAALYSNQKMLNSFNLSQGKYMSSLLLSKNSENSQNLRLALNKLMKDSQSISFLFSNESFKIGTNQFSLHRLKLNSQNQMTTLSVHTSIKNYLQRFLDQYQRMYDRRAFIHWYVGEGISDGQFFQACQNVRYLISQYQPQLE